MTLGTGDSMPSIWLRYLRNTCGHFAVQFALLGLPLVVATTFVIDYARANAEKVKVKTALDAAVIAAVNNDTLSLQGKEDYAEKHFQQNYEGEIKIELNPQAKADSIEMSAFGLSPVTVADALGIKGVEIYEKSAAVTASENVICVMALDKTAADTITFEESVSFQAPSCSVQANSSSPLAISSKGSKIPTAKSFCAVGGVKGKFEPYGKGDCQVIEDPYKHVKPAMAGNCMTDPNAKGNGKGKVKAITAGDETTLYPGTYCGGLTVTGMMVRFMPGDYVIQDGSLTFKSGSEAKGEDVTFTMSGSLLDVKAGSKVYIKAPRFGDRAGLAFMEDTQYVPGKKGNKKQIHNIKGGGSLNILGTVYFPTQSLIVKGEESQMGAQAPATSFIANDIHFTGINSAVQVKVDHVVAGLPPVLPRVEDGARLVQ